MTQRRCESYFALDDLQVEWTRLGLDRAEVGLLLALHEHPTASPYAPDGVYEPLSLEAIRGYLGGVGILLTEQSLRGARERLISRGLLHFWPDDANFGNLYLIHWSVFFSAAPVRVKVTDDSSPEVAAAAELFNVIDAYTFKLKEARDLMLELQSSAKSALEKAVEAHSYF